MTAVDPYWRQRAACDPTVANELTDVGPVAARAAVRRWCWTCPVRQMCREDAYQQPVLGRARNVAGGWWWDAAGRPKNLIDDPKLWKEAAA